MMTTPSKYATLREWLSLMALGGCTHASATLRLATRYAKRGEMMRAYRIMCGARRTIERAAPSRERRATMSIDTAAIL